MSRSECCFNLLLGFSVLSWAFLGLATTAQLRPVAIQFVVSALHVCVGILILFRAQVERNGSVNSCLASLPALLIAGWALYCAPPSWNLPAQLVFIAGGILSIVSFLYLGRCFAILPAIRGTVTRGPFRIVRHPAYLGELLMILSCCLAVSGPLMMWPLIVTIPLIALRIVAEERVMAISSAYAHYTCNVRWRLIPLVW